MKVAPRVAMPAATRAWYAGALADAATGGWRLGLVDLARLKTACGQAAGDQALVAELVRAICARDPQAAATIRAALDSIR